MVVYSSGQMNIGNGPEWNFVKRFEEAWKKTYPMIHVNAFITAKSLFDNRFRLPCYFKS